MASVWSLSAEMAFEGQDTVHVGKVSDEGGERFTAGTQLDFENATALPELNEFLKSIGYGTLSPPSTPSNLNDYSFRFHSIATGSVFVLGGSKTLGADTVTNDLTNTLAELNSDSGFVNFITITSTVGTIIVDASTDISFSFTIGNAFISDASGTLPFANLSASDQIKVVGSNSNDLTYTVSAVQLDGARIQVNVIGATESAGAAVTIIKL
jgi:hypothetical protein